MRSQDSRSGRDGQAVLRSVPPAVESCERGVLAFTVEARRSRGSTPWDVIGFYDSFWRALDAASGYVARFEHSSARVLDAREVEQVRMDRPNPVLSICEERRKHAKYLERQYYGSGMPWSRVEEARASAASACAVAA